MAFIKTLRDNKDKEIIYPQTVTAAILDYEEKIGNYYNKTEVDNLIANVGGEENQNGLRLEYVNMRPEVGEENVIYVVAGTDFTIGDEPVSINEEWIYINERWELLGWTERELREDFVNVTGDTMTGELTIGTRNVLDPKDTISLTVGDNNMAYSGGLAAIGNDAQATGLWSVALGGGEVPGSPGYGTAYARTGPRATGHSSLAVGQQCIASGRATVAMGDTCTAETDCSIAAGVGCKTTGGHIALGCVSEATADYSVAIGYSADATAESAMALGSFVTAQGNHSTAMGRQTIANEYNFAIGHHNKPGTAITDLFIIGNGADNAQSNAFRVNDDGAVYGTGAYNSTGADYAEIIEWVDGNPNDEDRVGKFVCIEGEKMRFATSADKRNRIGAISAVPAVVGDSYEDDWKNKYKTDIFGRRLTQMVHHEAIYDEASGLLVTAAYDAEEWILSEEYDATQTYIPREARKEFDYCGMLGKLIVIDDGTCQVGQYCYPNDNAIATAEADEDKGFYVMKRLDETHIQILLK